MYPDYLYHYTSVDTLEKILQNKSIRFNSLDKMDDRLEQWSAHGRQEGSHVFISSWTDQADEIKDMWINYCKPDPSQGIRIKLPSNPFSEDNKLPEGIKSAAKDWITIINCFIYEKTHIYPKTLDECEKLLKEILAKYPKEKERLSKIHEKISHSYVECLSGDLNSILFKVEYTNDRKKLFPWMYSDYKGMHFEEYGNFGIYKDTSWSWQHEWRYKLHFRMLTPGIRHNDGSIELYDLPFKDYYLKLDRNKIKDMEITLSPVITEEAKNKVSDIIQKYNPSATIKESMLSHL